MERVRVSFRRGLVLTGGNRPCEKRPAIDGTDWEYPAGTVDGRSHTSCSPQPVAWRTTLRRLHGAVRRLGPTRLYSVTVADFAVLDTTNESHMPASACPGTAQITMNVPALLALKENF